MNIISNNKHMLKILLYLKNKTSEVGPCKKAYIICFNDSHLKMMKNAFYFIWKALFVLKISKFLSWFFGPVEKTALLEI